MAGQLCAGRNVLDIRATNTGGSAGLIAELFGDGLRVATDATWRCAKTRGGGGERLGGGAGHRRFP